MSTSSFIHDDWLLLSPSAQRLYHDYAAAMPIYDFHSHLNPQEISSNRRFRNIADLALSGDHYKWRALRWLGVDEQLITGNAPDKDKFMVWARSLPEMVGNPLYHWTHLELKRYFGIDELLSGETADSVWERCNEQLQGDELTTQGILKNSMSMWSAQRMIPLIHWSIIFRLRRIMYLRRWLPRPSDRTGC